MKAMLGGKFITLNTYIRKEESSQINDLNINLRKLEKEKQIKRQNKWKKRDNKDKK